MTALSISSRLDAAERRAAGDLGGLVARLRAIDPGAHLAMPPADGDRQVAIRPVAIRSVTNDSRRVTPGAVFVAVPGLRVDGHDYAARAAAAGARVLVVERGLPDLAVPQVVVASARRALAETSAWLYGDPSYELGVIGITGTDGKTTTTFLAAAALSAAGLRPGLVGTVATQIGGIREPNAEHSTTPEAPWLQQALRAMVDAGDRAAIIETTSHGLAMDRVAAIDYDIALLTNLTHEHLELHGTFEAYRAAKRSLFERLRMGPANPAKPAVGWPRTGIVNADDPSAPVFEAATREAGAALLTFGRRPDADVRLLAADEDAGRLSVRYHARGLDRTLRLRLAGRFNASNALGVVAIGLAHRARRGSGSDRPGGRGTGSGSNGADRSWPTVRCHRRLCPQPGVARTRPR